MIAAGLRHPVDLPNIMVQRAGDGTQNFKLMPAMSECQLEIAMAAALLDMPEEQISGAGTGLDQAQTRHKAAVSEQALQTHWQHLGAPVAVLRHLGGFEIAA